MKTTIDNKTSEKIDKTKRTLCKAIIASNIIMAPTNVFARKKTIGHQFSSVDDIIKNTKATKLSEAIKNRSVSCVEVMNAYLNQISEKNPSVNAIVALQERDKLIEQAQQKDKDLSKGIYHGWMHGFPHAVKDLALTKGIVSSMGSPIFKNYIPKHDDIIVERIKNSGAILIGKTNVPEFGLGSNTYNKVYGTTGNAYNPKLVAGGSSGGASVALAMNMVPVADGSDMMGSLRNPAAYNNIIGFRPSFGRVPSGPTNEVFIQQLGYNGPMGRNVKDTAMLLSTMAGYDSRYPLSIDDDPLQFTNSLDVDVKGKKIAWLGDFNGYLPMEKGVLSLCESNLKIFEGLGCHVESVSVDFNMEQLWETWLVERHWLITGIASKLYSDPKKREQLSSAMRWEIENGLKLSGVDTYKASINRTKWYSTLNSLFDEYDAVVLPSAQVFPFNKEIHYPTSIGSKKMDTYHRWMEVVIPGTLSGCPIVNIPAGFNPQGLPMGMQLIGKNKKDFEVLQLAHAYEEAMPKIIRHAFNIA